MNKVLIDKKSNLMRGFADLKTPEEEAHQLLISSSEQISILQRQISVLKAKKAKFEQTDYGKHVDYTHHEDKISVGEINKEIKKLNMKVRTIGGKTREKRGNVHLFIVNRLKPLVSAEAFAMAVKIAKQDFAIFNDENCKAIDLD